MTDRTCTRCEGPLWAGQWSDVCDGCTRREFAVKAEGGNERGWPKRSFLEEESV